jgi:putative flippase GtrA/glycosyltransferase involved in cell wall biosynthesis
MTTHQEMSSSGRLVATLPLPAVVVPDFADLRRVGERMAGQLSWSRSASPSSRGRHAAPKQSMLPKVFDGSRFLLFSAIGGFVFLIGFGLQAWMTSGLHISAIASYLAQAVLSIETSFLLNRWLTWRDRDTPFLRAFVRFNAQKTITVALNLTLYGGLLWLGMNYLVANVTLTALFTVINFVAGDRFVFVPADSKLAKKGVHGAAPFIAADAGPGGAHPVPAAPHIAVDACPRVSVVIPCRSNEQTIGAAVRSLLDQDYPGLTQIILIGSPGDTTWHGLAGISDRRLVTLEIQAPPGVRDANYKRNSGIKGASGDLIALIDSDMVLPDDWMTRAVAALKASGAHCVAGGMRSIHDTYWGRYTDSTRVGAKTRRIASSYSVTKDTFGASGRKPPITANTLFTREMYAGCPIDPSWSHGSYEDYEWFWRVVSAGYRVQVCDDLFGWHHHRRGMRPLIKEYLRSSRGCAYFVRAHLDSPLSKLRLRQAVALPLAALVGLAGAGAAVLAGYGALLAVVLLAVCVGIATDQVVQSRRLESLAYPITGLTLGVVFTSGLITHLIRARAVQPAARATVTAPPPPPPPPPPPAPMAPPRVPVSASANSSGRANGNGRVNGNASASLVAVGASPTAVGGAAVGGTAIVAGADRWAHSHRAPAGPGRAATLDPPGRSNEFRPLSEPAGPPDRPPAIRLLTHPLLAICVLQVALSLTLIRVNTAFTDEADYLWIGRLVLGHYSHGGSWPVSYGSEILPGSPLIYPPVGALAASIGGGAGAGLVAARLASLLFMLGATVLLYLTASKLIRPTAAAFAAALWVLTEPVQRLAFATAEPLAIFFLALAAWLVIQARDRNRHGEFVAAAAFALALANATAYSSTFIDPVLVAFAYFVWLPRRQPRGSAYSAAWFAGGWMVFLTGLMVISKSWSGFAAELSDRDLTSHQGVVLVLTGIWGYAGLIIVLGLVGAVVAGSNHDRKTAVLAGGGRPPQPPAVLMGVLGGAALIVPLIALLTQSTNVLDRRLAFGLWFAAIAAGYGCGQLLRWLPQAGRTLTAAVCLVAVGYLGISSWQSAADAYRGWPNASAFITAFKSAARQSKGQIFVASQEHVAQYYSKQGDEWTRWNSDGLTLDPPGPPTVAGYIAQLHQVSYGLVVLFYSTSFTNSNLPTGILTGRPGAVSNQIFDSAGSASEPGLQELTEALQRDHAYQIFRSGPFNNANDHGVFVIWRKQAAK